MGGFPVSLAGHPLTTRGAIGAVVGGWALLAAAALTEVGPEAALLVAALPAAVVLRTRRAALFVVLLGVVAATVAFGRDFAYLRLGPLYVMDTVLLGFLLLALPELLAAARRPRLAATAVAGILGITALAVVSAGVSWEVLRQSVIGFYAVWAFIGMAMARRNLAPAFARTIYVAALVATFVWGMSLFSPDKSFTETFTPRLINGAESLYVGFGLLLVFFAPLVMRSRAIRALFVPVALVQGVELALGEVRSIWVAFPAAVLLTLLVCGGGPSARRKLLGYTVLAVGAAVVVAFFSPSSVERIAVEATSIYDHGGASSSDANSRWRVEVWGSSLQRVADDPVTGVGFGGPGVEAPIGNGEFGPADIHNSFLAFALRLGIPALLLLAAFELAVLRSARRLVRAGRHRDLVQWLLACQLLTAVHALFTVVLEGPYMGIFFWLFGGLVIGLERRERDAAPAR